MGQERSRSITLHNLINDVAEKGICSACGTCVVACPYGILKYENNRPQARHPKLRKGANADLGGLVVEGRPRDFCMISEGIGCDVCAMSCPKLELPKDRLETSMFGRTATEDERDGLGIYDKIEFTRTTDERVKEGAQDGGFVTTLLLWAFEEGIIDGAVVAKVSPDVPCKPAPFVATSPGDIVESAGSWYTYSPNTLGLIKAREMGLKRVAFVGTPCQITPLRRLQVAGLQDFKTVDPMNKNFQRQHQHVLGIRNIIAFTIGLFCSETFTYEGLMQQHISQHLGVSLHEVTKVNIKGKMLVYRLDGQALDLPLKEVAPYARPQCSFCGDFSAQEADISAGGVGTRGWTLTLPRTKLGTSLYERLKASGGLEVKPAEAFRRSFDIAKMLARKQRERQRRACQSLRDAEEPNQAG